MDREAIETWGSDPDHQITIVARDIGSARWKCSCGATMGGRWCRSAEEALKRAERHLQQAERARPS